MDFSFSVIGLFHSFTPAFYGHGGTASNLPGASGPSDVRSPAVAGSFYPSDPEALRTLIKGSLEAAKMENFISPIKALIAPHAGTSFAA